MDFILSIIKPLDRLIKQWCAICLILFSSLTISTITLASTEYNYQQIANIELNEKTNHQWLELIANPGNKQQFYLANDKGQLFLIDDGDIIAKPLLDLNKIEKNSTQKLQLTAFTLHPDFAFRDQPGFATFYTAHIGKIIRKSSTKLLKNNSNKIDYQYQAVITEWQFNQVNLARVELSSQREILRIALIDQANGINQLAFNPFKKSWNDDYGLLYFSLPAEPELSQLPLHSGVIFRINPTRFGRKNYTVPSTNPYIDNSDIADEIILLGGQEIKQFIWPQKNNDQQLVSHQYNNENLLTLSKKHNDWRNVQPEQLLSHSITTSTLVLYQGRALEQLHRHLLYIDKTTISKTSTNQIKRSWQLNSIRYLDEDNFEHSIEQILSADNWTADDKIKLFVDSSNEVILLDESNAKIYRITEKNNQLPTKVDGKAEDSSFNFILISLIIICCGTIFFIIHLKRSQYYLSSLTRRNFAHLEVSQSKKQVGLYRRHQHTTDTVLNITDIIASEILLNNTVISLINSTHGHGFNDLLEENLRHYFSSEYQDKMIDEKIRTIGLTLSDNNHSYPISLYARKGNKRLTKKSYKRVIEELIDWCWLVANTINADNTTQRKHLAPSALKKDLTPVKTQQSALQQTKKQPEIKKPIADKKQELTTKVKLSATKAKDETSATAVQDNTVHNNDRNNKENMVNTELVNSLEKLVNFKQQGFLTEEEFLKAKKKLLANLMD